MSTKLIVRAILYTNRALREDERDSLARLVYDAIPIHLEVTDTGITISKKEREAMTVEVASVAEFPP
jgi:hypothetical protein